MNNSGIYLKRIKVRTQISGYPVCCQRPFPAVSRAARPVPAGWPAALLILFSLFCHQAVTAADNESARPEDTPPVFVPVATSLGTLQMAQDVSISMRDETRIALDIYRPDDNASHPVLYAAGPFPHTRAILNDESTQAGPVSWYVSQGYTVVIASVRGTGLSTGEYGFLSRQEQQDHYEIVQWINQQPWSNGLVAGTGAGYYAAAQWQLAIQNPPGLTCIAPINGTLDPYREWVAPGGLANVEFMGSWYENQVRLPNAFAADTPHLISYDMRLAWLMHPYYDEYWRERSSRENTGLVSVPVFAIHDWTQGRDSAGFTTTLNSLGRLNVVNKQMFSTPAGETPLYQDTGFLARELLPFYDWCFNGKPTASLYIERPRVQYRVRGQNSIKRESNWPPGNITHQDWYPVMTDASTMAGSLADSQQAGASGFTNLDRTRGSSVIKFVSAPLEQDMEITGPAMMELYAATTGNDMAFEVTLKEQIPFKVPASALLLPDLFEDEPGQSVSAFDASTDILVTRGKLKASARQRDDTRSTEYLPVYAFTEKQALSPGQVYRLDIAMRQTAYRFSQGSRIVLEINQVNDGSLAMTGRDTIYHNTRYPTRLWLPEVQTRQVSPRMPAEEQPTSTGAGNNRSGLFFEPGSDPDNAPDEGAGNDQLNENTRDEDDSPVFFVPF